MQVPEGAPTTWKESCVRMTNEKLTPQFCPPYQVEETIGKWLIGCLYPSIEDCILFLVYLLDKALHVQKLFQMKGSSKYSLNK